MLMMDGYIHRFLRSDVAIRAKHLTKMRIAADAVTVSHCARVTL
jgi:hypothetical protein